MTHTQSEKIRAHIENDRYAEFLGATLEEVYEGYGRFRMVARPEFINFNGLIHGGVIFSISDLAFAAAGNSRGQTAYALGVDISFIKPVAVGDVLIAECSELSLTGPIGIYEITVRIEASQEIIAHSKATLYRKKSFFVDPTPDSPLSS